MKRATYTSFGIGKQRNTRDEGSENQRVELWRLKRLLWLVSEINGRKWSGEIMNEWVRYKRKLRRLWLASWRGNVIAAKQQELEKRETTGSRMTEEIVQQERTRKTQNGSVNSWLRNEENVKLKKATEMYNRKFRLLHYRTTRKLPTHELRECGVKKKEKKDWANASGLPR